MNILNKTDATKTEKNLLEIINKSLREHKKRLKFFSENAPKDIDVGTVLTAIREMQNEISKRERVKEQLENLSTETLPIKAKLMRRP